MILPIYTYGQAALRKETHEIDANYPKLKDVIDNMFETMYRADGVGLAAPQVGLDVRLFIVDLEVLAEDDPKFAGFKKVFINPKIVEFSEEKVKLNEGCLSLPDLSESVERSEQIRIQYFDQDFVAHDQTYDSFFARCIQHEYDHLDGVLFTDRISPIRKQLVKGKLNNFLKGKFNCHYKIKPIQNKH